MMEKINVLNLVMALFLMSSSLIALHYLFRDDNKDYGNYRVGDKVSIYGYTGIEPDIIYGNRSLINCWGYNVMLISSATVIGKQRNTKKPKYTVEVCTQDTKRCFVVDESCMYLQKKSDYADFVE